MSSLGRVVSARGWPFAAGLGKTNSTLAGRLRRFLFWLAFRDRDKNDLQGMGMVLLNGWRVAVGTGTGCRRIVFALVSGRTWLAGHHGGS